MKKIFLIVLSLLLFAAGLLADKLPPCPESVEGLWWHLCFGSSTAEEYMYVGEWKDNVFHGYGTYTWAEGGKYVGEFQAGKRHGTGTHTEANGSKYIGEYQLDKRHGYGTFTWADGDKYVGEYQAGKIHGTGTYRWGSGSIYEGQFYNNSFHGKGTCYVPNQGTEPCEFKDGEIVTKGNSLIGNILGTLVKRAVIEAILN